jgi:hypothetical protein
VANALLSGRRRCTSNHEGSPTYTWRTGRLKMTLHLIEMADRRVRFRKKLGRSGLGPATAVTSCLYVANRPLQTTIHGHRQQVESGQHRPPYMKCLSTVALPRRRRDKALDGTYLVCFFVAFSRLAWPVGGGTIVIPSTGRRHRYARCPAGCPSKRVVYGHPVSRLGVKPCFVSKEGLR